VTAPSLVFLGSPPVAADVLRALVTAGHDIRLVITAPDRRRGRGSSTSPTAVGAAAHELGLAVSHTVADAADCGAELGVIVAFGRIIRAEVLDRLAMVNIHFSLLPRWRGAAPVERAVLAGDPVTGVCLMQVVPELDAGAVYSSATLELDELDAPTATRQLGELGTALLLDALAHGFPEPVPQAGEVVYADKITPDDLRIDWSSSADTQMRVVRTGAAWTTWRGERIRILEADIVDGRLRPVVVQPAGRQRMNADDWFRGVRPESGEWFA
jgi:methionyl-tRNA formyltransferase